jgi:nucleotide-binding universal stress UspA family protein
MTETMSPVARAASEETHAPVTLGSVDRRAAARPRGPVVLATDFGAVSVAAERVAIAMASSAGVSLVIVHAIDLGRLRLPGGRFTQRVDQARAAREHDTAAIVRRIWAAGVRAQVLVWEGDPATCVVEAARAEGAAAIVVGSHRRGRLGRLLAGSVSSDIAEHADCPVHIVPGDGDGDEDGARIASVRPASAAVD